MIRAPLSTTSVLDESADVVSLTAAPWAALAMLTAIPYRFLQAIYFDQLIEAGGSAAHYGHLLGGTANLTVASIVLAFWGRAVYARACRLALARGAAPGRETWRLPPAAFASYVLTGSAAVFVGFITMFSIVGFLVAVMFAGVAIGTMELNQRVSVIEPFRIAFRHARRVGVPFALVLVFAIAAFVAFVNLSATFGLGTWLVTAIGGFDAPQWSSLFDYGNRRYNLMLVAGALVLVEPFWIAAYVVYVRKTGAQESGDDLRTWFEELRRPIAIAVAFLCLAGAATVSAEEVPATTTEAEIASAPPISIERYIASLEEIRALLSAKQIALAQEKARALADADVTSPRTSFHADSALLARIASTQRDDLQLQAQLALTIDELRRATGASGAPADRDLLRRVAADQAVPELVPGGEVPIQAETPALLGKVGAVIGAVVKWIGKWLGKLLDWAFDFLPGGGSSEQPGATGGMRWIVTALVIAVVLLVVVLAFEVTRRSRAAEKRALQTSTPLGSKRDEDPLSRGVSEWERYAAQLAAEHRYREAIRAWYHAVLVTCYSAGLLHYRKSRTNWEYVAALAPSLAWRGELIQLTQRFEREWYGSEQSSSDAYDDCAGRAQTIIEAIHLAARGAA